MNIVLLKIITFWRWVYYKCRGIVSIAQSRLSPLNLKGKTFNRRVASILLSFGIALSAGHHFLGEYVQKQFRQKALETVSLVEPDIVFVSSLAPLVCVYEKNRDYLEIGKIDSIKKIGHLLKTIKKVDSDILPEAKAILKQVRPFDSLTTNLLKRAKGLSINVEGLLDSVKSRIEDLSKQKEILDVLRSITETAMMLEEFGNDVSDLRSDFERIETQGLKYKDAALNRMPRNESLSEPVRFIANHYITRQQKIRVASDVYEQILATARSNRVFARYDNQKCFSKYKGDLKTKIQSAIINAF